MIGEAFIFNFVRAQRGLPLESVMSKSPSEHLNPSIAFPVAQEIPQPVAVQSSVPNLERAFRHSPSSLAQFLPKAEASHLGLEHNFFDVFVFLSFLQARHFSGYLHMKFGDQQAVALLFRGQIIAAEAFDEGQVTHAKGEAVGQLVQLHHNGGLLSAHPVAENIVLALVSILQGNARSSISSSFSGAQLTPRGANFYENGRVIATMLGDIATTSDVAMSVPENGPQFLSLPNNARGWAHSSYTATLRGRDVLSPITLAYGEFRNEFGTDAAELMRALLAGKTPTQYAVESAQPLTEVEMLLRRFQERGYLVREG